MHIQVKNVKKKQTYTVEVAATDSVATLKALLGEQGADFKRFQLAFKGKKLTDDGATLASLAAREKSTMLLMPLPKALQPPPEAVPEPEVSTSAPVKKEEPAEPPALCLANCGFYGYVARFPAEATACVAASFYAWADVWRCAFASFSRLVVPSPHSASGFAAGSQLTGDRTSKQKGYCSKCYSDLGMAEEEPKEVAEAAAAEEAAAKEEEPDVLQEDVRHCWKCRKDVGLLGFKCQCKYVFCAKHRYGDKHDCPVDYRAREQKKLNKNLEKVVGGKVMRIG